MIIYRAHFSVSAKKLLAKHSFLRRLQIYLPFNWTNKVKHSGASESKTYSKEELYSDNSDEDYDYVTTLSFYEIR